MNPATPAEDKELRLHTISLLALTGGIITQRTNTRQQKKRKIVSELRLRNGYYLPSLAYL
jgi:hypothetical protein